MQGLGIHGASAFELVVLDPAGRIRFSNAQASALLDDGDVVCRSHDRLAAANRRSREALQALIRATLHDASERSPAMPRVIPLPRTGRLPLIVIGLPISGGRAAMNWGAALLVRDPEVRELPPPAMVREVFGLTPSEAGVAPALGADRTLKEIAAERRWTLNIVRTLVSRVLHKTGCRRQAELARVLGALCEVRAAGAGLASGMAIAALLQDMALHRAAAGQVRALLQLPLQAPPNQHATIVERDFSPGENTGFHLHDSGHEIICVLEGALTMEYLACEPTRTGAGEAVYVPPGVVHQGRNDHAVGALYLFHVGIGPAGSIDRRNL